MFQAGLQSSSPHSNICLLDDVTRCWLYHQWAIFTDLTMELDVMLYPVLVFTSQFNGTASKEAIFFNARIKFAMKSFQNLKSF